jgi:hypothetical protein
VPPASTACGPIQPPIGRWTTSPLCREHGIRCTPPSGGGSHWKVSDPTQRDILTVPNRRPVKAVYIRRLVRFIEQVQGARHGKA